MIFLLGGLVGFVAGFISTLLGGGAGLIATPAFYYLIVHVYGVDHAMQIALATCCGMSIFLSVVASYKHIRRGTVSLKEFKGYLIALAIGAVVGAIIIKHIDAVLLKHIFAVILFLSGIWMVMHNENKIIKPPKSIQYVISSICGLLSVLASSTTFATMFFIKVGIEIKKAISTASICVFINSVIATILLVYGINIDVPNTYGYISIPLLVSSAPLTIIGSLLAVKYLNIISPMLLRTLFIGIMFLSSIVMML